MDHEQLIGRAVGNLGVIPAKTLRVLISHLRDIGMAAAAVAAIAEMERRYGPSGSMLDARADLMEREGFAAAALAIREERVATFPDPTGWQRLARHLLATGTARDRLAEVDAELAAIDPDSLESALIRIEIAIARDRMDDAHRWADALYAGAPRSSRPGLLLARMAVLRGDQLAAKRLLADVAERFGTRTAQLELSNIERALNVSADPEMTALLGRLRRTQAVDTPNKLIEELRAIFETPEPEVIAPVEEEPVLDDDIQRVLMDVFGYDELRPGQREVISRCLSGLDTLAIMPTGAGKSLTFQIPAMLTDGAVVVVSPLIALMQDQLSNLPEPLRSQSTFINSSLDINEIERRLDAVKAGSIKLVYAAPERFRHRAFLESLRTANVQLIVIDEAHCISMWGHDFRPDYLYLPRALEELGDPPMLAVTATATRAIADQIGVALGRSFNVVRTSAFRPNLRYSVERFQKRDEKITRLIKLCRETDGSIIVYVSARAHAEELAERLLRAGVQAVPYHAGMNSQLRAQNQSRFIANEVQAIVATIAFGMGINKPDVRALIHFAPSRSLENYIQESGRAGRDGLPSKCVLLTTSGDIATIRRHANERVMSIEQLRGVYAGIKQAAVGSWAVMDRATVESLGSDDLDVGVAVGLLEQAGLLRRHPDTGRTLLLRWSARSAELDPDPGRDRFSEWLAGQRAGSATVTVPVASACAHLDCAPTVLERALSSQPGLSYAMQGNAVCLKLLATSTTNRSTVESLLQRLQQAEVKRVDQIVRYLESPTCRHLHLARHLNEQIEPCGDACDVCLSPTRPYDAIARTVRPKRRDDPYFAALAEWRTQTAREMVVPAYVVASDRLLETLATAKPRSRDTLRQLQGIGMKKDEQFGEAIVRIIQRVAVESGA